LFLSEGAVASQEVYPSIGELQGDAPDSLMKLTSSEYYKLKENHQNNSGELMQAPS
jgi:hypothetical protein